MDALAERAIAATFDRVGIEPSVFVVSVMGCNDERIRALNADFRAKEAATNVLSWPSQDLATGRPGETPLPPEQDPFGETELGDIALSFDTCTSEAEAAKLPFAHHCLHLIVHGTLHLLGYDHIDDQDAALMEGLEVEILATLGVADPY
nr:rRNA maturation RNase YbeY [Nereida sp. MMG025]